MQSKEQSKPEIGVDQRLARAIGHPLRVEILAEVSKGPMSPVQFRNLRGGLLSTISYHFRELADLGCLELISERQVRGAVEHTYQAARRPLFTDVGWASLPASIRAGLDTTVYRTLLEQIAEAIEAGTMEARPDRVFTWTPVKLDGEGWLRIMGKLSDLLEDVAEEEVAATARMAESGETPINTTVAISGFESPPPKRDRPMDRPSN